MKRAAWRTGANFPRSQFIRHFFSTAAFLANRRPNTSQNNAGDPRKRSGAGKQAHLSYLRDIAGRKAYVHNETAGQRGQQGGHFFKSDCAARQSHRLPQTNLLTTMVMLDGAGVRIRAVASSNATFLERPHNGGDGRDGNSPGGATLGGATAKKKMQSTAGSSGLDLSPTDEPWSGSGHRMDEGGIPVRYRRILSTQIRLRSTV